jgi:hypothetical protein
MRKRSATKAAGLQLVPTVARQAGLRFALALAAVAVSAGCTAGGAVAGGSRPAASDPASRPAARQPKAPAPAVVIVRHLRLADGHLVTTARFGGGVRFVLHCGSADPGAACRRVVRAGPRIGGSARRMLVAAFNGGFKLAAGVGGYEQEGKVIKSLIADRASLVIYRSGAASIGAWGRGVPKPGQAVYSVRQNLNLLVADGHPTAAARGAWVAWGATITGVELTARSALGENARGQLIYAASMSATPADLAVALVRAGARIGMELDINAEWVQLAYARQAGGHLIKGVPGQVRPAKQYLHGWTRDFITVLAAWTPMAGPGIHLAP